MDPQPIRLVIFDCDGVLVDSEGIALEVLVEALAKKGVLLTTDEAADRFLGRSLGSLAEAVRSEFGVEIDPPFLAGMRDELYARFRAELEPLPGVATAIESLKAMQVSCCVASSSQRERIELSLSVTGLLSRLSPHIFSATMVERGKPAPDLFLHAAAEMGISPSQCLVIEDSPAGIRAAQAAGMKVIAFTGGSHTGHACYKKALTHLAPDGQFDAMENLLHFVLGARRPEDLTDA
ncbi:putative hydrolase phosphatase protein [Agrobacterium albertimagni AOL15]|uniref:Putative hydrolase phosphatase protein n=1 Tax=Agrobacterium albertimagni AOL15 TaxID=1156935 RepID=K2QHW5_9HYPH|nr:HAD family hydrolase [Agrobacterium albertimagni]EKF60711.1 putative hydrolase phosphatase protein [Agrobacterium albertimagni AOL15]